MRKFKMIWCDSCQDCWSVVPYLLCSDEDDADVPRCPMCDSEETSSTGPSVDD